MEDISIPHLSVDEWSYAGHFGRSFDTVIIKMNVNIELDYIIPGPLNSPLATSSQLEPSDSVGALDVHSTRTLNISDRFELSSSLQLS